MKIAVINGSPKGENSISLQTILYLQKKYPMHVFSVIHAAKRINQYEKDFSEAKEILEEADLILFSYPVYTFLVPSQLHRFIVLMKEKSAAGELCVHGKYVSQFSTSKHFYDVTAHRFVEENMEDLGLQVIKGLSADMEDLTKKSGQKEALGFMDYLLYQMKAEKGAAEKPAETSKPVVIVADLREEDASLKRMIETFCKGLRTESKLVNIREFPFKGGCLGCLHCAADGKCIYNDRFDEFLRTEIQQCSAFVYAFTIQDHSMGARFKTYDDRQFCNGHRAVTMGLPMAYLISGRYSKENNLKMVLDARAENGGNFLAGTCADENRAWNDELEAEVKRTAEDLQYAIDHAYAPPANFYGVGGRKIFRDLIYQMQGFMKEDHRFFKKHKQYDFPQKKKGTILAMYLVGFMMNNEKLKKKLGSKINEGMLAPYKKVLDEE